VVEFDVCPGVHAVVHAHTNCFIVEGDDGVTLVDAGYPSTWTMVEDALTSMRRTPADIRALLITHGHFDHVGFAAAIQRRFGVEVWVNDGDFPLAGHPYRYQPERPRGLYPLRHPRSWPVLGRMVGAGALKVPGVRPDRRLVPGPLTDLPGRPTIHHVPGHTDGSTVIELPDRRALITGDALVTLDPYTGRTGPRIVAPAATHDSKQARASLTPLAGLPVDHVLPGHGAPWHASIASAVEHAQRS
jgi:glyoxylase-like metal-dependent hydrolase (beta-lactamase superfamily II)